MIYLSLGSNLGNRISNLRKAVELLKKNCLKNLTYSIILETESILPDGAPASWNKPFLNMIVRGQSDFSPEQLLEEIKSIEREIGRPAAYEFWSPRIIDIDILLWDNIEINSPNLIIPHPEIKNRAFLCHLLSLMGVKNYINHPYVNCFKQSLVLYPEFVGIVNVTEDSFSDGGKFAHIDKAIEQIIQLSSDGASIIDIGAQSTRPGASISSDIEEYERLKPILEILPSLKKDREIEFSIDSFHDKIISKILGSYPVSWINNVKGRFKVDTIKLIAEHNCKLCIMHSLSIPPTQEMILPLDQNPIIAIKKWAEIEINKLLSLGLNINNIIIDPGIGFGKSIYQNLDILNNIEFLRDLNVKILVGHSRKGYINAFSHSLPADRDLETIAMSAKLINKVNFLRVHNVKDHMRFLSIYTSKS